MVTSFVHNTCSLAIYAIYWFSIVIIIMQLNYSIKNCFIYIFINKKEKMLLAIYMKLERFDILNSLWGENIHLLFNFAKL